MLVLSRKHKERILIGTNIWLTVFTKRRRKNGQIENKVSIGIEAPKDVVIAREELLNAEGQA